MTIIRSVYPKMSLPDNIVEIDGIYENCFEGMQAIFQVEFQESDVFLSLRMLEMSNKLKI